MSNPTTLEQTPNDAGVIRVASPARRALVGRH